MSADHLMGGPSHHVAIGGIHPDYLAVHGLHDKSITRVFAGDAVILGLTRSTVKITAHPAVIGPQLHKATLYFAPDV